MNRNNKFQENQDIYIAIGKAIQDARALKGYTKEQLSLSMTRPVCQQQIAKYEKAINRIPIAALYDIAQALDVNILDLLPDLVNKMTYECASASADKRKLILDYDKLPDQKIKFAVRTIVKELAETLTNY